MDRGDLDFLRGEGGRELLELAASLPWNAASRVGSTARVRAVDTGHAAAAIDVVTARARARGRIRGAEHMLLTDEAVQQATPWPVAALRARRLSGRDVHDVTCSVGAELVELTGGVDTIRLVAGGDLEAGAAAVGDVPGVERVLREPTALVLTVRNAPAAVAPIVTAATGAGMALSDVEISRPDLESVFLHLTGKALRD